jgi:hypothetical protein
MLLPGGFTAGPGRLYFTCSLAYPSETSRALISYDVAARRAEALVKLGVPSDGQGVSFRSGLLAWGEHVLFAGVSDAGQLISRTEPWSYSSVSGEARQIDDLYPGVTLTCNDL